MKQRLNALVKLLVFSYLWLSPHSLSAGEITDINWYQPGPETSWYWQLQSKVVKNQPVDLYNIDLFDSSESLIRELQHYGYRVICYFSAGSWEKWRKDAKQFQPQYIGNKLYHWEGEYWLDIRAQAVRSLMRKRLILAKQKGCDGVEADNIDGYLKNRTGFNINQQDQLNYAYYLAHEAHHLQLAIGLKNVPTLAGQLAPHFDFAVSERCHEHNTCHYYLAFLNRGKAVFNAEYAKSYHYPGNYKSLCQASKRLGIQSLLVSIKLDGKFACSCTQPLLNCQRLSILISKNIPSKTLQ